MGSSGRNSPIPVHIHLNQKSLDLSPQADSTCSIYRKWYSLQLPDYRHSAFIWQRFVEKHNWWCGVEVSYPRTGLSTLELNAIFRWLLKPLSFSCAVSCVWCPEWSCEHLWRAPVLHLIITHSFSQPSSSRLVFAGSYFLPPLSDAHDTFYLWSMGGLEQEQKCGGGKSGLGNIFDVLESGPHSIKVPVLGHWVKKEHNKLLNMQPEYSLWRETNYFCICFSNDPCPKEPSLGGLCVCFPNYSFIRKRWCFMYPVNTLEFKNGILPVRKEEEMISVCLASLHSDIVSVIISDF